ncbi:MAG TPA: HEAT repeat domain-containing protein [Chitinophaga sp.]|uniref:HEAT repeat domain-containing protein n=1 Tax=Chitinophaga sp. TaxID=1869181 RepID=UPI002B96E38A|nr:HEAT repeat domain-containing protein [Chitinophaga sp.]HVI45749.1 HEAT repeat domain-containing protein [Chitinophaga sp.]
MFSFFNGIESWFVEVKENFFWLPTFIKGAIIVSLLAIAGIFLAYLNMLLLRAVKYFQDRRNEPVAEQIDVLMLEHMVQQDIFDEKQPPALNEFRKLPLHHKWGRELLVQKILHYRRNFSGHVADLSRSLYIDLGLHQYAQQKLSSPNPKRIVEGLSELFNMEITVEEKVVLPLINHHNRYVREMARCYFAKCSAEHPMDFLQEISKPLLAWEQFELFRLVTQRTDIPVPSFARWIDPAYHPSVISFCLKLAAHFQQFDAIPAVMSMLKSENLELRALSINSLGKLMALEAELELVSMYEEQPLSCREEILKALGRIGSGRQLDFLRSQFLSSEDFEIKKQAAKSIVNHKALAQLMLQQLQAQSVGQHHTILQHCLNPLIKY